MSQNESVEYFLRFLKERFNVFQEALKNLLRTVTLEDRAKKAEAAQTVLSTLDDLKRAMSTRDHPAWITPIGQRLQWYIANIGAGNAGFELISTVLNVYSEIQSQTWEFDSSAPAINFAAIYEEYYAASRVPQLFDELVGHLEEIINSGEIDSIQTINALEKLIATIRKNSRGDYFSTRGAWEFTQSFLRNLTVDVLESTPGIKHFVKALRKTMSELDLEMNEVHEHVKQKLLESVKADLPMLEYKMRALPAPPEESPPTSDGA